MANNMAGRSIFDCDSSTSLDLPQRKLISYGDDDDLFAFDADEPTDCDEIDSKAKNVTIRVTIDNSDGAHGKRKRAAAFDDDDDDNDGDGADYQYEPKKKRISNVSNGSRGRSVATKSRNSVARNTARSNHTKSTKSPYELGEVIGEGTYGTVYKGRCTTTQTVIAIKRLRCPLNTPSTVNIDFIVETKQTYPILYFNSNSLFRPTNRKQNWTLTNANTTI